MFSKIITQKLSNVSQRLARLSIIAILTFGLALFLPFLPAAQAAQPVIDRVNVDSAATEISINITFNKFLRYVSHSPRNTGKLLVIELRPVLSAAEDAEEFRTRERANLGGAKTSLINEIRFEGDHPTGPKLEITFSRNAAFRVQGAADLRSIKVFVQQPSRPKKSSSSVPAPPDGTKTAPPAATRPPMSGTYVINLASAEKPFTTGFIPNLDVVARYRLYNQPFQKNGRTWYRLRLGFFATKKEARDVIRSLPKRFADAWIAKADAKERENSAARAMSGASDIGAKSPETPKALKTPKTTGQSDVSDQRLTKIWDEAKGAMTRRDFRRAVQLYTKLLQLHDHQYKEQAKEFLGLARERNGQLAHARAEYESYLKLYPKGEGAERVRQRLAGILTARSQPKSKLRGTKRSVEKSDWETQNYGGISQFYTYRESVTDAEGRETTQSDLVNDLDVTTRLTSDRYDLRALFVGSHAFNFADDADSNASRVSSLYFDALDRKSGLSGRIGRQTRNTGGVLGRFDGAYMGYQVTPSIKLNGVTGLPVTSTQRADFDKDRYFYGISTDLGPYDKAWNFTLFAINQDVDGINERRAVGGEARYLKEGLSIFSLLDYDITFNDINIALFNGTATLEDRTTINLSIDYRKSPILLATNALQGQGTESVASLLNTRSADEVRDLAEDRSATSHSVTLGASHPLNKQYQISGDVTATRLGDTEASGGVEAAEGTNYELFYSAQLTGTSLIKEGDVSIIGLRFSDTKASKTATMDMNVRYPIDRQWRLNPRLRTDYRLANDANGRRIRIRPSMRVNYRWKRPVNIEFETGGEWASEKIIDDAAVGIGDTENTAEWFARLGYRYDF